MAGIRIEALAVAYAGSKVIDGLSLDIAAGSFFTLLGPSGCGKTTLLRTLAGFQPVAEGRIFFAERDVTDLPAHKRDIGMVFQDYALFPDKTVFDNVAYGLRARKLDESVIKRRVGEYLERVGLAAFPARRPAELSGGQRQRVALARALVIQPQVLLMDEPLSNLDAKLRVQVRETIADLQREAGITTVFVTHDQEEALALSDRIGLMRLGRIEQNAVPEDIYRKPVSAYVADFVGAANILEVATGEATAQAQQVTILLGGKPLAAYAPGPVPGGKAVMIARPEDIRLSHKAGAANSIEGTILRKQYLGSRTSYRIVLADGVSLAVDMQGDDHERFSTNEPVWLTFDRTRTLVTPQ